MKFRVQLLFGLLVGMLACSVHAQSAPGWNPLNLFKKQQPAPTQSWPGGVGQPTSPVAPVSFIQKWNRGVEKTKQALTIPSFAPGNFKMPQLSPAQIQMPQIQMPGNGQGPKLSMPKVQLPKIQMPRINTQGTILDLIPRNNTRGGQSQGLSSLVPSWLKPSPAAQRPPPTANEWLSQKRP